MHASSKKDEGQFSLFFGANPLIRSEAGCFLESARYALLQYLSRLLPMIALNSEGSLWLPVDKVGESEPEGSIDCPGVKLLAY